MGFVIEKATLSLEEEIWRWRTPPRPATVSPTAVQLQSDKKEREEGGEAAKGEFKGDEEDAGEEGESWDRATQTAFNKHLVVAGSCNYIFYVEKKVTRRRESLMSSALVENSPRLSEPGRGRVTNSKSFLPVPWTRYILEFFWGHLDRAA